MDARIQYLNSMSKMVGWISRRYATLNPMLGADDLYQDGVIELLNVYDDPRNQGKPLPELCAIGRTAVVRCLYRRRKQEWAPVTKGYVTATVSLNAELPGGGTLADIVGAQEVGDMYFWFAVEELERSLDDLARTVLTEMLAPSEAMLAAVRLLSKRYQGCAGNWWQKYRIEVLATLTKCTYQDVSQAFARIRTQVERIFGDQPKNVPYREVTGKTTRQQSANNLNLSHTEREHTMGPKGYVPGSNVAEGSIDLSQALAASEAGGTGTEQAPPAAKKGTAKKTAKAAKPAAKQTAAQRQAAAKAKKAKAKPAAKVGAKANGKGRTPKVKKERGFGIISSILEFCAPSTGGCTKDNLMAKLIKRFPDHAEKGMSTTMHIQLGGRLVREKGCKVTKKGEGKDTVYTVSAPKS